MTLLTGPEFRGKLWTVKKAWRPERGGQQSKSNGGIKVAEVTLKSLESAKVSIMFQVPIPVKVQLDNEAEELGIGTAALVRQIVAEHYGIAVEAVHKGRARKYASDEERKEAQKNRDKARRDLIKELLEKFKEGGADAASDLLEQLNSQAEDNDGQ